MALDDRELEQISQMLERGGKMLADHCVACKSPLFKFEGKTTCPVCTVQSDAKRYSDIRKSREGFDTSGPIDAIREHASTRALGRRDNRTNIKLGDRDES